MGGGDVPDAAPVTIATFPSTEKGILMLLLTFGEEILKMKF